MLISGDDMIRCDEVQNYISDYSVGNLDRKRAAAIEAHLRECSACSKELRFLEAAMSLVESMPEAEPPAGMWVAVYERITLPELVRKPSWLEQIRALFAPPTRALAAGFAVLALMVALTFGRMHTPVTSVIAGSGSTEYVQSHVMFAAQDAFADKVGLASVAAAGLSQKEMDVQ